MKNNKSFVLMGTLFLALFVFSGCSKGKIEKFQKPDIKDDFCGVVMNFQYCKCAFHNEYCDNIGLDKSAANSYVQDEYDKWAQGLLDTFADNCELAGGIYKNKQCNYCEDPYIKQGDKCVKPEENDSKEPPDADTAGFVPDGPFDSDCNLIEGQFDTDWKKYSDFDYRLEPGVRSWEVQQHTATYEKIIELMARNAELERDMEIDREMRLALREYKMALVQNMRNNLIKATTRLAYITYTTIKSGIGTGQSYSKVLSGTEQIERIGAALKVFQASVPANSKLAIDTSDAKGKVASIGVNAALEALESIGDPTSVVKQIATDSRNAILPSADISQEEFDILRDQRITNQFLTEAIADSYRENAARRAELLANEKEIARLQAEATGWEAKEKTRIKDILESQCNEQKANWQKDKDTSWHFLNSALAQTEENPEQTIVFASSNINYDRLEEEDGSKLYYNGDKLLLAVYDSDSNSQDDTWLRFDDDLYLMTEAHDTTGDGQPDTYVEFDKDENIKSITEPEQLVDNTPIDNQNTDSIFLEDNSSSNNKNMIWGIVIILLVVAGFIFKRKRA
ncbi:hypothetical protein KKH39_04390 [Patescibacteria group bacterium]|nr:hypothetical protein [Patescibacteria group bacterium]